MNVVLVDYGAGNLRSVTAAFEREGAQVAVTIDPDDVATAPLAVIAGVGHVASAAAGLAAHGLDDAVRARAAAGRPTAGICVGMQLLFGRSEEGGEGLALLAGEVRRVDAPRVPHMGWNTLQDVTPGSFLDGLDGEDVYFAHSYATVPDDTDVTVAVVEHGGPIASGVQAGPLAGVQFHPERSGEPGAQAIRNLVTWSRSV